MALKDKKNHYYFGQMSYKHGLISGTVISVIVAILSPLVQWIVSYIISPEYFPNVIDYSLKTGYHKTRGEAEAYFNYRNYAVQSTIASLVMGVLTTAIAMIFIRTKRK